MRQGPCKGSLTLSLGLAAFIAVSSAAAQTYRAETFSSPPPEELAPQVRELLGNEAIRVTGPTGPLSEIWLRKIVPARTKAAQELGIAYGELEEGSLVGAIRFLATTKDYCRQQVRPGVYTLRYSLYPPDGIHMGISPHRDFLLLAPGSADTSPAPVPFQELMALTKKAPTTSHASAWSLLKTEGGFSSLPSLTHAEAEDHWVLHFRVQLQPTGGTPTTIIMSLVVAGFGPEG